MKKFLTVCMVLSLVGCYGCEGDSDSDSSNFKEICEEQVESDLIDLDDSFELYSYSKKVREEVHDAVYDIYYDDCISYYDDYPYCKNELIAGSRCIISKCDSVFDKTCQKVCRDELDEYSDCFEEHKDKLEKYDESREEIDVNETVMDILKKYDEDIDISLSPCAPEIDPCKDTVYPYCHIVNGLAVCSILASCPPDSEMGYDGLCSGGQQLGLEGEHCSSSSDCSKGLYCYNNYCSSAALSEDYKYIRIKDLSVACTDNCDAESGADIDAIVLKKMGTEHYATKIVGYMRADGQLESSDNKTASNPQMALGKPDAFKNYPIVDGCYYYKSDVAGDDETNRSYTFVSLGGDSGYLIAEMDTNIEAGDRIDVLELGECTLFNTEAAPNKSSGKTAQSEMISIEISTDGNSWRLIGSGKADSNNKGIISFTVNGI